MEQRRLSVPNGGANRGFYATTQAQRRKDQRIYLKTETLAFQQQQKNKTSSYKQALIRQNYGKHGQLMPPQTNTH